MKICLFNVENLFLLDSALPPQQKKAEDKVVWLGQTVTSIDPDILMLCEVGGLKSLEYFNQKQLNNNYIPALLPGNSDRGIEMGYLIHKRLMAKHQLISHKDLDLNFNYSHRDPTLPSLKFSRDVAELHLYEGSRLKIIFFLVHLKSKLDKDGIDPLGAQRREAEVNALVKLYLERRAKFPNTPLIVAGDFNGVAQRNFHEPEFKHLYAKTDLEDVLEVINEPHEQRFSYCHFSRENVRESSQIDYIFLPPELHPLVQKEESGIYLFRDNHGVVIPYPSEFYQRLALPSDHYPLVATLVNF